MRVALNGIVAEDDDVEIYQWFGMAAFGPRTVRQAIEECPEGEELIFEINSGGGSVMAGSEMYSVLRNAAVHTRAEVQSLAASAASYLALGCREVLMSPVAQMMIHLPSTITRGDRSDHLESVHVLDTIRESILNAYELKARGKTERAELKRMMNASTWLTAQEAVEKGLADGILYQDEVEPQNIINAVGSGLRAFGASGGVPNIEQMRAEYRRQKQAEPGGVPAADNRDWTTAAALDLEKIRF